LLNADQHFGHRRFSSQILPLVSLSQPNELAAVGSREAVLARLRDNPGDSLVKPKTLRIKLQKLLLAPSQK
jgi:hypothetical protein